MTVAHGLRLATIAIALAALVDPTVTIAGSRRPPLTVAVLDTPSLAVHDRGTTRRTRMYESAFKLRDQLDDNFDVLVREQSPDSSADPCGDRACVVLSDGAKPLTLSDQPRLLGAVLVGMPPEPNLRIERVTAPPTADTRAVGMLEVQLESRGMSPATTELDVFDDNVLVGHTTYTWRSSELPAPTANIRVEWTPVSEGIRDLRVLARPSDKEVTSLDNEAHVAVDVAQREHVVMVHEPQPTWSATFVRRALEGDGRFRVLATARLGGALAAANPDARLDSSLLTSRDLTAVIVSAPNLLTASEVDALDRFVRLRGGSLVLLMDSVPSGAVRRLWPGQATARSVLSPLPFGPLKAAEFIAFDVDPTTSILAGANKDAVVVTRAIGQGRIVAFGASDAWRYRDDGNSFANFWKGLVADAAGAAGDPVVVTLSQSVAAPGERIDVDVEWRAIDPITTVETGAAMECGQERSLIRLLPANSPGRFRGSFSPAAVGWCRVRVSVGNLSATAPLVVTDAGLPLNWFRDEISQAIEDAGGPVVSEGQEEQLVTALRPPVAASDLSPTHPMRSPWWIAPFAACLGGEWWLRRRSGQR